VSYVLEQFIDGKQAGCRVYCRSLSEAWRMATKWKEAGVLFVVL